MLHFYSPDFYIDTIQTMKRVVTDQIYKDKTLNKAANDYITAQTQFAKMLVHNTIDITTYSVESMSKYFFPKQEEKVAKAKATSVTVTDAQ